MNPEGTCDYEEFFSTLDKLTVTRPAYDPKLVDWRSARKSIEYITNQENRFCGFAVRSHFHDAGAPGDIPEVIPSVRP